MIDPNHPEWLGPVGVVLVVAAIVALLWMLAREVA